MFIKQLVQWIHQESQKSHAILLPLRLFIGLGWLRSSAEKLVAPEWYSGHALNQFFYERIAEGDVVFPFYQALMEGVFSAHAPLLSKLVIVGEFYCGIAILFGLFTRPALLVGIFMNLNFILAGSVNPSAFYIVIQMILLSSAVGQVFGIDSFLLKMNPIALIGLSWPQMTNKTKMRLCLIGSLLCALLVIPIAGHVQTVHPAQSVEDPAMLLLILLVLQSLMLLILGGRTAQSMQRLPNGWANRSSMKPRQLTRRHRHPHLSIQQQVAQQ